jgi:hypothetical protein
MEDIKIAHSNPQPCQTGGAGAACVVVGNSVTSRTASHAAGDWLKLKIEPQERRGPFVAFYLLDRSYATTLISSPWRLSCVRAVT